MLVTGNTFWGRNVRRPFARLGEFHRDRYDAWISGLECPTVPGVHPTHHEEHVLLKFNCDPALLEEASHWFTAFTLANNHTDNQGRVGVDETRRQLAQHGIAAFGDPDPHRLADVCKVLPLQVQVTREDGSTGLGHLPVGLCGFHGVFEIPPPEAIDVMRRLAQHVPVLALPHSGLEYVTRETGIKVALYRSFIEAGADAVLGDHAHWVQNSEAWHGRPIFYSMGNFIFDQHDDAEVTRSAAVHVKLRLDEPDLEDWLDLGEQCLSTDCTTLVEDSGLPKPDVRFGFGIVGTTNVDGPTHPASPAQQAGILARLDWADTVTGLRPPYGPIP